MANSFKFNFSESCSNDSPEDTVVSSSNNGCKGDHDDSQKGPNLKSAVLKQHEVIPEYLKEVPYARSLEPFSSYKVDGGNGNELFYVTNQSISNLIQRRETNKIVLSELLQHSDLNSGVYEGGFKVWECSIDLVEFLKKSPSLLIGKDVLELGCGAGLPGIHCLLSGSGSVCYQDFNEEVIDLFTIPNALYNSLKADGIDWSTAVADIDNSFRNMMKKNSFLSGDWESCNFYFKKVTKKFDIILSSETIYNPDYYPSLHSLMCTSLNKDGFALIASKTYYFGVGGSTKDFIDYVAERGDFKIETVMNITEGVNREILKLEWK